MGVIFPLFHHWELHQSATAFQIWWIVASNFSCQFSQDPWMHLIRSHGLVHIKVPQIVSNLIFYSGRYFNLSSLGGVKIHQCFSSNYSCNHRVLESLRLEKTSKIMKSNSQYITTMPTKPCPKVSRLHRGWWLHHFPGQPVAMLDHSFSREIFPNIQSKPPLIPLEDISFCPVASYLGEETNSCLTTTTFQVVVESDKISPQPPLLQTK